MNVMRNKLNAYSVYFAVNMMVPHFIMQHKKGYLKGQGIIYDSYDLRYVNMPAIVIRYFNIFCKIKTIFAEALV